MAGFFRSLKFRTIAIGIAVCILAVLYSYFVADTIQTTITDAQMTKVDGRFMIATENRPYVNEDVWYRFKFNSGTVQNDAIRLKGKPVRIKKYGWRMPMFSRYENVVKDRRGEVDRAPRFVCGRVQDAGRRSLRFVCDVGRRASRGPRSSIE